MKTTAKDLSKEFKQGFPRELKSIYRFQGAVALLRCLAGTLQVLGKNHATSHNSIKVEGISCSVIPELAKTWTYFFEKALKDFKPRIILADSSGNYRNERGTQVESLHLFNFSHATKLDLLMQNYCQAEYVLICDDDIFWLNDEPLKWALEQFEKDDQLAVVSLHPRPTNNQWLDGLVPEAMGSYCLVIRRDVWINENLSFQPYKPPDWKQVGNHFDTADYANLLLVQRGFHVLMAPPELRDQLIPFYGTSMWGLKILACRGQVTEVVNPNRPDEHKKAYRTSLSLLGFQDFLTLSGSPQVALIPPQYLQRSLVEAAFHLDAQTRAEVEQDIQGKLNRMQACLSSETQTKPGNPQG